MIVTMKSKIFDLNLKYPIPNPIILMTTSMEKMIVKLFPMISKISETY